MILFFYKIIKFSNTYNRMGVRNRSFRIEDDPMGDNFRQSLEDIRVGFRETVPKVNLTKK